MISGFISGSYITIKVLDKTSKKYVHNVDISLNPNVELIGSPGTGAVGPFLYNAIMPIPVVATISSPGYKNKKEPFVLWKGREMTIYLEKQ